MDLPCQKQARRGTFLGSRAGRWYGGVGARALFLAAWARLWYRFMCGRTVGADVLIARGGFAMGCGVVTCVAGFSCRSDLS